MKKLIPIILAILIVIPVFAGDVVTLTNNKSFCGKVKKIENTTVKFRADGKTYFIPADDIYSIVFENANDKVLQAYLLLDDREKCFKGGQDASLFHGKAKGKNVIHTAIGWATWVIVGMLAAF